MGSGTRSGSVATPAGRSALRRAIRRYRDAPLSDRLFIRGRALLADLPAAEVHVPWRGLIVDLGCGRGLFSNLLLEAAPEREVLGLEPDPRRLAVAALTERPGLRFQLADATSARLPECDAVVIVDVLYLLRDDYQDLALANACASLRPGGRLVIYAQERSGDPRFWLGYAQELIATGVGLTRGHGLHYSSRKRMRERLERCGFAVDVFPLRGRAYTDAIYVGVKPGS